MKECKLPAQAGELYASGPLREERRLWASDSEGWSVEMFGREECLRINEDLEICRKMPGWFAIGQDADDSLLCVDSKSGSCAMVEVDDICKKSAQEISSSLEELLAQGSWR